jgi:hypothetical protein
MAEPDPADHDAVVERFPPTNGRLTGVVGLVVAAAVLMIAMLDWDTGTPLGVVIAAVLGALVVWVTMLRPALWTTDRDLVMRGMLRTDRIPLAAIDQVVVAQALAVSAGGRRYVSPVIGYSARQSVKARFAADSDDRLQHSHQQLVETRIAHLAGQARDLRGTSNGSPQQQAPVVRRTWAWPEIAAGGLLVLALVVWLLV